MTLPNLDWLPEEPLWSEKFRVLANSAAPDWAALVRLAGFRVDMVATGRLDKLLRRSFAEPPPGLRSKPIRLALLSSSTVDHLLPAIRVAGLRRNLWVDIYSSDYSQYQQELLNEKSALYRAAPDTVLFSFDATHFFGSADPRAPMNHALTLIEETGERISGLWRMARQNLGAHVIQQTFLPRVPTLMGSNEHRLGCSRAGLITRMNARLRLMADAEGVDLLGVDDLSERVGIPRLFDPMLWHRAKQEISPSAAVLYGDLVGRLLSARRGLSFKCLVLDLDNTLWGGVIGDDGMEGIKLGQGSAIGEAYVEFQRFCKDLSSRGIILAVCSKNDEVTARSAFHSHPDMVLRDSDIACFIANWDDKPANIREIARRLNIGLDAIVFADDNPFERNIVRRELPMVAVPDLPEDPALYAECISDAGYFESVNITEEDLARGQQYQANIERDRVRESATDMAGYLRSLDMQLIWAPFDSVGLSRIVQLINKTNQFNLTTRRYSEAQVATLIEDSDAVTMQIRLKDKLGDNGMISVIIGRVDAGRTLIIDTWLMSCRVLGRQVEQATMNVLCHRCSELGIIKIVGEYIPTPKNDMVRDHYCKLGFKLVQDLGDDGSHWELDPSAFEHFSTFITVRQDA